MRLALRPFVVILLPHWWALHNSNYQARLSVVVEMARHTARPEGFSPIDDIIACY
jgi:hypothetical protein